MKTLLFPFIIVLLFLDVAIAQSSEIFEGTLSNSATGKPVAYANIGYIATRMGTSTDEYGHFRLKISDYEADDTLRFQRSDIIP